MTHQYMIVTRFAPGHDLAKLRARAEVVKHKTASEVPELASKCGSKHVLLGASIDAIDIFKTDDAHAVARAANIIASHGEARTEILPAIPWGDYVSAFSSVKHQPEPRAASGGNGARKYAIITRFNQGFDHASLPARSTAVKHNIRETLPGLTGKWSDEFVLLGGSFDGFDVVESDSLLTVARAANIIRTHGACTTEVAVTMSWNDFVAKIPRSAA